MTEEARAVRNAYQREYARKHRERRRQQQTEYWERKAKAAQATIPTAAKEEKAEG